MWFVVICLLFAVKETAEVNPGVDATVWSSLHAVHGSSIHWGHRSAVADSDALWDALQLFTGIPVKKN